ncbi:MAG: helix-turn-helix transcriptional regulator [Planctomycetes bacterium]|nr:helix-turn-helix transcriptional regulator [Planctomycetota bacterium]
MQSAPLSFGQLVRTLRTTSFNVVETRHPIGMVIEPHEHEHACLNLVLQGHYHEAYAHAGGEFPPLSACFKPAGESHSNCFERASARCLLIEIRDEGLVAPGVDLHRRVWTRDPYAASLGLRIWRELADPDGVSSLSIDEWVLELFTSLLGEGSARLSGSARLHSAVEALHDAPRQPWTLSRLALQVGLHPSHLARAFRTRHGCTIGEYQRRLRLNEAARRLALGDEPLSSLSMDLGFADQSHCTRAFRRQFGTTPAKYRRVFRG